MPCPFCQLPSERILHSNAHAHIIRDGFPISPGHTLIIPKRHIASFFDTTPEERNALLELLDWAKAELETNPPPRESFNHLGEPASNYQVNETEDTSTTCETEEVADTKFNSPSCETGGVAARPGGLPQAYNIGINDGPAAGQTVPHLHIHLIPRYSGDTQDPRGGVRWIMPEKAKYW